MKPTLPHHAEPIRVALALSLRSRCNRSTKVYPKAGTRHSDEKAGPGESNMMRCMTVVVATVVLVVAVSCRAADDGATMIYELRTYTAAPGKLDDLHKRFREHTMQLFEKHGIKNVAYFVPLDKPDTLVYVIAHKSREAAAASWKAFRSDPEWQRVAKESEKNGKIVLKVQSLYLTPTDYSPLK
jgi:hypothetical protein